MADISFRVLVAPPHVLQPAPPQKCMCNTQAADPFGHELNRVRRDEPTAANSGPQAPEVAPGNASQSSDPRGNKVGNEGNSQPGAQASEDNQAAPAEDSAPSTSNPQAQGEDRRRENDDTAENTGQPVAGSPDTATAASNREERPGEGEHRQHALGAKENQLLQVDPASQRPGESGEKAAADVHSAQKAIAGSSDQCEGKPAKEKLESAKRQLLADCATEDSAAEGTGAPPQDGNAQAAAAPASGSAMSIAGPNPGGTQGDHEASALPTATARTAAQTQERRTTEARSRHNNSIAADSGEPNAGTQSPAAEGEKLRVGAAQSEARGTARLDLPAAVSDSASARAAGAGENVQATSARHGGDAPDPQVGRTSQAAPNAHDAMDRVRFVQRVARAFEMLGERQSPVRLRLHPPELGSLKLEIAVRNGVLTAHLEVENASARAALLDNLPALRQRLAAEQIRVDQFEVDLMNQSPGQSAQHSYHPQAEQRGLQGSARLPQNQAKTGGNAEAAGLRRGIPAEPGRIDVIV